MKELDLDKPLERVEYTAVSEVVYLGRQPDGTVYLVIRDRNTGVHCRAVVDMLGHSVEDRKPFVRNVVERTYQVIYPPSKGTPNYKLAPLSFGPIMQELCNPLGSLGYIIYEDGEFVGVRSWKEEGEENG